jgi:hypothetical protein
VRTAQVADVAQRDHCARHLAARIADRGDIELDRALAVAVVGDEHAAPAEVDARAGLQRLAHGVGERLAIRLVDEMNDLGNVRPIASASACRAGSRPSG